MPSPIKPKPTKISQLATSSEVAKASSISYNHTAIFEAINDLSITQIQPKVTSNPTTEMSPTLMMSNETTSEANKNGTIIGNQDSKVQIIVNVHGGQNSEKKSNKKRQPKSIDASDEIQSGYQRLYCLSLITICESKSNSLIP